MALSACYREVDLRVEETICEAGPVGLHEETVPHMGVARLHPRGHTDELENVVQKIGCL